MTTETCSHGHAAPVGVLTDLPHSQGGVGRHTCVVCAYALGRETLKHSDSASDVETCKHGRSAPLAVLGKLPESQAGTGRHKCAVCAYARGLDDAMAVLPSRLFPNELERDKMAYAEGAAKKVLVNTYERDPTARRKCIEHYGVECAVCGMTFETVYGELGAGFIHVHHLRPVSQLGAAGTIDPIRDLRPVCPNCHAMLHQDDPPLSIEWLRGRLRADSADS